MKKKLQYLFIVLAATALMFSCKTTPAAKDSAKATNQVKVNSFMKANMPLISEHTLDNGIKVIVKKQNSNRIFTMNVIYKGGLPLLPKGKDGIEALTLSNMLRGSKNYSYDDIMRISFENSSAMSASASIDYSSLNLSTIDKYWDDMLTMFSDAILNPKFDEKQFELVKKATQKSIKEKMSDPMTVLVDSLHQHTFADHPYLAQMNGTEESLNVITLEDLKNWYTEKLTADRMMIVAAGNFNPKKLVAQLNKTIGKIPVKHISIPEVKKLEMTQACYTVEFPTSKGIAYIRGDYNIPSMDSKDYAVLQFINYSLLRDLIFEVVRTQNAACYSVWAGIHGFKTSYGSFTVFKTDKPTLAKTSYDEAIAILASGKAINLKAQGIKTNEGRVTESSGPKYAPIEENLETYKAKFINGFYSDQVTNSAAAAQIAYSQIYYGNSYEYLKFIDKVNAITAEDIVRVANKYLVNGTVSWCILGDKGILSKVDKTKFMEFTGKVEK